MYFATTPTEAEIAELQINPEKLKSVTQDLERLIEPASACSGSPDKFTHCHQLLTEWCIRDGRIDPMPLVILCRLVFKRRDASYGPSYHHRGGDDKLDGEDIDPDGLIWVEPQPPSYEEWASAREAADILIRRLLQLANCGRRPIPVVSIDGSKDGQELIDDQRNGFVAITKDPAEDAADTATPKKSRRGRRKDPRIERRNLAIGKAHAENPEIGHTELAAKLSINLDERVTAEMVRHVVSPHPPRKSGKK